MNKLNMSWKGIVKVIYIVHRDLVGFSVIDIWFIFLSYIRLEKQYKDKYLLCLMI